MPVTGPMLRTLAVRKAKKNKIERFAASEGWLSRLKERHGIFGKSLSGESGGANKVIVKNWIDELPALLHGYEPADVFNCDETGLFFKAATNKSLVLSGDSGHGTKKDKSRLTLLMCCS